MKHSIQGRGQGQGQNGRLLKHRQLFLNAMRKERLTSPLMIWKFIFGHRNENEELLKKLILEKVLFALFIIAIFH